MLATQRGRSRTITQSHVSSRRSVFRTTAFSSSGLHSASGSKRCPPSYEACGGSAACRFSRPMVTLPLSISTMGSGDRDVLMSSLAIGLTRGDLGRERKNDRQCLGWYCFPRQVRSRDISPTPIGEARVTLARPVQWREHTIRSHFPGQQELRPTPHAQRSRQFGALKDPCPSPSVHAMGLVRPREQPMLMDASGLLCRFWPRLRGHDVSENFSGTIASRIAITSPDAVFCVLYDWTEGSLSYLTSSARNR